MTSLGHDSGISRLFRLRRNEVVGWRLAAGCALASLLFLCFALVRFQRQERVWVLSGSGGLYAGPLERLDRSRAFFHESSLIATLAALQWSAAGIEFPELVKIYYGPRAVTALEELVDARIDDLKARSLATKPLIQFVSEAVTDGSARLVEIRGLLATNGQFAGRLIYEEPPFTLSLRFERNPDLGMSGAYPWIITDVRVDLGEAASR
jgi:hypothetical protein